MPRELITIQVGQCGNQIGGRFWDLALTEHNRYNKSGVYDEAMSTFFRNVDARDQSDIPVGDGRGLLRHIKARAVMIDMEEGVIGAAMRNQHLAELFDSRSTIVSNSGSGNNWAHGHLQYGTDYRDRILDVIRHSAEKCDSLQSFFLIHSMGGGTGSGLGTYILQMLGEEFPDVYRFTTAVYPSHDDDVVTSPYNSVLAMNYLSTWADCVLPIENQALLDICASIDATRAAGKQKVKAAITDSMDKRKQQPFDQMNNIAAQLLLHLTSSMRFEGPLNVDLNEITMNLVPYPHLHFLIASLTPLYSLADVAVPPRRLQQMFVDAFSPESQLIRADPKHGTYLACALISRGAIEMTDIRRSIDKIRPTLRFVNWNQEGWKIGACNSPPLQTPHSLLCLANNTCIRRTFSSLLERFHTLYSKRAWTHLYHAHGADEGLFADSVESLQHLVAEYDTLEREDQGVSDTRMRIEPI